MESVKRFYSILFDPNEEICWSSSVYGVSVFPKYMWETGTVNSFFSINPLKDYRKDDNVTCFRNILLEFDDILPINQEQILVTIPYSTLVWSGGKSNHAIISLEQPCKDRVEYDALVKRIHDKVPQADKSTKNPSRFSRSPGAIRDSGNTQTLRAVNRRISREELEAWLGPEQKSTQIEKNVKILSDKRRILMPTTNYFLYFGAEQGSWNVCLFNSACDMTRAGYTKSEIIERMSEITGHLDKHDKRTIDSAWDTVHRDARS